MGKDQKLESLRHHLFRALELQSASAGRAGGGPWQEVSASLSVHRLTGGQFEVSWTRPMNGAVTVEANYLRLYSRNEGGDSSEKLNRQRILSLVMEIGAEAQIEVPGAGGRESSGDTYEEVFHDEWASGTRPEEVMVRESFLACTAVEHRFMLERLGAMSGKRVLDLGCGLGEAAVFFALEGADVTASDVSAGMLRLTEAVAGLHGVVVKTQQSSAQSLPFADDYFDVVYAGNLLHHVEVEEVLPEIRRVLRDGGQFLSWDPLAHNPIINVYRRLARDVRTPDEHPLKMGDLELFRRHFSSVETRCFWLSTLAVFLRFFLWERVHPGRERYWKKILVEHERLESFFIPLRRVDDVLLRAVPFLRRYCWNVVVISRK